MRHAAAERHQQFDTPAHRPSDRQFREACRAAMKRHHVDATTAATLIVTKIAPKLPEAQRVTPLGLWRAQREQIVHLVDRLHRRR